MSSALKAIAEPRRQEILRLVRDDELSAGEIASHFDVTRPAVSQHLRVLNDAALVTARAEGTKRVYSIDPSGLAQLHAYVNRFWDQALDSFKQMAEGDK